jgi:hypothetical protein
MQPNLPGWTPGSRPNCSTRSAAADLQGRSVSDYVTATLQAAVHRDIAEIEIIRLSREASEKFAASVIDMIDPAAG